MSPSTIRPSMIVGGTLIGFFLDSLISGKFSATSSEWMTTDFQRWGIAAFLLMTVALSVILYDNVLRVPVKQAEWRAVGWRNLFLLLALATISTSIAFSTFGFRSGLSLGLGLAFFLVEALISMLSPSLDQANE